MNATSQLTGGGYAAPAAAHQGGGLGVSGAIAPEREGGVAADCAASVTPRISRQLQKQKTRSVTRLKQIRIRLPEAHTKRLLGLTPKERENVMTLAVGSALDGVETQKLVEHTTELRRVRLALLNVLAFASAHEAPLDTSKLTAAAAQLNQLLGGKP